MKTKVEQVSPERATELLRNNSSNRPINRRRVDLLAAAIRDAQWKLTHQGVALLPDGQLLDGQHRLLAIQQAGQTVPLMVTTLDEDVFDVIDTGRPRGPRDVLALAGITWAQRLPAAIRLVEHYRGPASDSIMGGASARLTNHDYLRIAQTQPAFERMAPMAERVAVGLGRRGLTTGLLASMVVIAEDAPGASSSQSEFWNKLQEPVLLGDGSPILALRRWLTVTWPDITRARGQMAMYGTIRAWNAYAEGRTLGRIQVRPENGAPEVSSGARAEETA
ncbi:hypothetical protein [Janibacter terrae]|uniref:hypothetical protein n=1 Tax=Janibacter terrae TaxID=103817 RepID=UPI0031F8A1E3